MIYRLEATYLGNNRWKLVNDTDTLRWSGQSDLIQEEGTYLVQFDDSYNITKADKHGDS